MRRRKLFHALVVLSMVLTLIAGATAPAMAQAPLPQEPDSGILDAPNRLYLPAVASETVLVDTTAQQQQDMPGMDMPPVQPPPGSDLPEDQKPAPMKMGEMRRMLPAERQAAADRAAALGLVAGQPSANAMVAAAVPGGIPDYFGASPNFANSPLPTVTTVHPVVAVGNALVDRAFATDYAAPVGTLGPVLVVLPAALPTGNLRSFQTWNQTNPGGSPSGSAGSLFQALVLRPAGGGQYTVVYDSGVLTVPPSTNPAGEVASFPVSPTFPVQAGDQIAFYGQGVPVDTGVGTDVLSYPAPAAPVLNSTITVAAGDPNFPIYPDSRTYSFGAQVEDTSVSNSVVSGGIRKFVDSLPGLGPTGANNLGQYIPVAVPDTTSYPNSEYYEIGLVQYQQQFHSDLPPTTLRGYVQLSTATVPGAGVPLKYADGSPILLPGGAPALGVDSPHYLGPIIVAQRDRPVRVKFYNLLPTGQAGNLFIPVDTSVMGSGMGPAMAGMADPNPQDPMCNMSPKPSGCYSENRATIHLHGGNTPWISDGTQHQWITPAGEATQYPQGVSVKNVPDMDGGNEPAGVQTFYYTNQQSARLLFYHDHAYGITRLNVYAGEAAGYLIGDPAEQDLVTRGIIPADQIPLIIQDKSFVPGPEQLALQDPTWDTNKWGGFGQLWYPHVYMPNQNPYDIGGANAMGRWDYGPWFWPPFTGINNGPIDNPYYDPINAPWEPPMIPGAPNPSIVPEGFMDTPMVNGTAYPYVTLEPKPYRLRILNAANDRFWNLQFYVAKSQGQMWDANGTLLNADAGEVAMVPFDSRYTFPSSWGTPDARTGGVPDPSPALQGPNMVQIGTEGGFMPAPMVIPNRPINYNYNRRDITVLNVQEKALFLGPAERADVVVDFSAFAGKTLILYNDAPAPVPASDPRVDYYTGMPSMVDTGGSPGTLPGYGPNTRTIMQIRIAPAVTAPSTAPNLGQLGTELPKAYAASHPKPIIPQAAYNTAFNANYPFDAFARIQSTSLAFANGTLGTVNISNPGAGYTSLPTVSFSGGGGTGAAATVTLSNASLAAVALSSGGSGYTAAPTVSFSGGGGTGAAATVALAATGSVKSIALTSQGSGYRSVPTVTIQAPPPGGTPATATATINTNTRRVTGITIINPGSGYVSAPTVTITGGNGSGAAATATVGKAVASITLTNPGSNYSSAPTVAISGGNGSGAAATATLAGRVITGITLTNAGAGYSAVPAVSITGGGGSGAAAVATLGKVTMALQPKSIIENFDPDYGRMNAMLGVEVPNTTGMNQTSIPYTDLDPATEVFRALRQSDTAVPIGTGADGTQIWKITHNGVDTHALHWHMFDVQVLNRVGWDGAVRAPDANELGWKDTVRMNPLEDIIVAMRPIIPNVPWDLPNSIRLLDVTMPAGSQLNFMNVDPTNQPANVVNSLVNFGWEYVWHCHLLGHEENIMMRPMIVGVAPLATGTPTAARNTPSRGQVTVRWADNSANETGFTIQRATNANGPWTTIGTAAGVNGAGATVSLVDTTAVRGQTTFYRVIANNRVGYLQTYAAPAVGYPNTSMDSAPSAPSASIVP